MDQNGLESWVLTPLSHQNWGSQQHISSEWGLDEIGDREAEEEQEDQDAKIAVRVACQQEMHWNACMMTTI